MNVYTKEMEDAGELPKVGMKCLHTELINNFENPNNLKAGDEVEILKEYQEGVIFRLLDHNQFGLVVDYTCNPLHFKPLYTQAEKDKDEVVNELSHYITNINGTIELNIFAAIKSGKIPHIKYTGAK